MAVKKQKKIIVTTTINQVTPAIRRYDAMENWELIVVGDRKSPRQYALNRGLFVSWEHQLELYRDLCKLIGPDNTMRGRMIALVMAHRRNADLVALIDDDCMPYWNWPGPIYIDEPEYHYYIESEQIAFDPIRLAYGVPARGFPPQLSRIPVRVPKVTHKRKFTPLLQSNLCEGQADVDAVFRLHGATDYGEPQTTEPFWTNGYSIINPMHTIIHGSVLKDYVGEIPFVGHVCDIWAGYLFQAWHPNSTLYCPANSRHWQDRGLFGIIDEIEDEIYSYRHGLTFLSQLQEHGPSDLRKINVLPRKAVDAIECYRSHFK